MARNEDPDYLPSDLSSASSSSHADSILEDVHNSRNLKNCNSYCEKLKNDVNDIYDELLDVRDVILSLDRDIKKQRESTNTISIIINLNQEVVIIMVTSFIMSLSIYFILC